MALATVDDEQHEADCTDSWAAIPSLRNLDAYISATSRLPMLTAEQEYEYATRVREFDDQRAADKLILSHLRLVVSVARQYLGYGLPHADLIQEGNIGLMKSVRRFDPDQGVRLVTYALHWIKAEIREYILRNVRIVRLATSKPQRKLFFNLRSMKQRLRWGADGGSHQATLRESEIDLVARELGVARSDVMEMETRLSGHDLTIDNSAAAEDDGWHPILQFADTTHEPSAILERKDREAMARHGLAAALEELDPRSRRIVEQRWLQGEDSAGMTLHQLAAEYGISAERVRQVEAAAMRKMRVAIGNAMKTRATAAG